MSENDSFIDEVNADLRRDRFFSIWRRYSWIAIALVFLIVGGSAWQEYQKHSRKNAAIALGEALFTAVEQDRLEDTRTALAGINPQGDVAALVAFLALSMDETDIPNDQDIEKLKTLSEDQALAPIYRDFATFGWVMAVEDRVSAAERLERLAPLSAPGNPLRFLAEEQSALIQIEIGETQAALARLESLVEEEGIPRRLLSRVLQILTAHKGS